MRKIVVYSSFIRVLPIVMLCVYLIYNIPFITNISVNQDNWYSLWTQQDGLYAPILRSVLLALTQTMLLLFFSLIIALLLFRVTLQSSESKYLGVLLIPVMLGNVSVAFLFKLLLSNCPWVFDNSYSKFFALSCIQFWQYGSLFIYLLWLNQQTIPQSLWDYANAIKLNDYEKIKDIIIPKQRNLLLLLFMIAFVFCYYEASKIEFIFKASRGTNTELVNQWLNRTYQSDTLLNANIAFTHLSQSAFYVLCAALLTLIIGLFIQNKVLLSWIGSQTSFRLSLLPPYWLSRAVSLLLIFLVFIPIGHGFYTQWASLKVKFLFMIPTLGLTTIAALVSTIISIFFAMVSRLAWEKVLSNFNTVSLSFLILLFSLILVPPVTLLILGFKWMQIFGYSSSSGIYVAWVLGHALLSFPILTSFSVATHFRVQNSFIQYLDAHQIAFYEKLRDLFLLPFQADYFLTFLLAFAMIWNEGTINNILSDIIPSFITELNKTITGKAADYANGMNYFLISLILAMGSAMLWNFILHTHQKNQTQS